MTIIGKYKYWNILEKLPKSWKIDNSIFCGKYLFITNGLSPITGRAKRAVMYKKLPEIKYQNETLTILKKSHKQPYSNVQETEPAIIAKALNVLARSKTTEKLLLDIKVDIAICELEGWDKTEYIKYLQNILNFKLNIKNINQ